MINVSEDYKKACNDNNRESYVIAQYGAYDKYAKLYCRLITSRNDIPFFINKNNIIDGRYDYIKYITCEPNRIKLDGSFCFIKDKNRPSNNEKPGFWIERISNSRGSFSSSIYNMTYTSFAIFYFSKPIKMTNITLNFQEIITDISIDYRKINNSEIIRQIFINDNDSEIIRTNFIAKENEYFDYLEISIAKTKEPYRRPKLNEIDFGTIQTFNDEEIEDYSIIQEMSIDSENLSSNSLELTLRDKDGTYDILNPNNKLVYLEERQQISMYHYLKVGNDYKETLLGTFLLKEYDISSQTVKLTCYDDIYFMNKIYYGSKFYKNDNLSLILKDLFNYFNYEEAKYIIEDNVKNIKLTGFVPNVEFREALRLICEASSCVLNKTRNGKIHIFKLDNIVINTFNRNNIFSEEPSKNSYNDIIQIAEYNYSDIQKDYEIYNSILNKGEYTIIFNDYPIIDTTIDKFLDNEQYTDITNEHYKDYENFEILEKYATSCKLNIKVDNVLVILKGDYIKYTSSNKTYSIYDENELAYKLSSDYSIDKLDNYLITSLNSKNVADWKLSKKSIKYNFDTQVIPYIEIGDRCLYSTKYNTKNLFTITKIEYTKSILQKIEGE